MGVFHKSGCVASFSQKWVCCLILDEFSEVHHSLKSGCVASFSMNLRCGCALDSRASPIFLSVVSQKWVRCLILDEFSKVGLLPHSHTRETSTRPTFHTNFFFLEQQTLSACNCSVPFMTLKPTSTMTQSGLNSIMIHRDITKQLNYVHVCVGVGNAFEQGSD